MMCGALNLTSSGLASHAKSNGSDRITFNQTNTTIQGDAAVAGSLAVTNVLTASKLEAARSLPNSYPTAGVYCGLVPTVGFANLVLNSVSSSSVNQMDFMCVGAAQPHATLVSQPRQGKFIIRMNSTPKLTIDATKATVHSDLVCSDLSASSVTVANAATIDSLIVTSSNMPMSGIAAHF